MVLGGIISILIAIWIFRTAREAKTGNTFYWVLASVVIFLVVQTMMIYFNAMIIEIFDTDISDAYDNAGIYDNDAAGLQSGPGGTLIGIIFEFLPFVTSFFVIAVLRLLLMLRQAFGFMALFSGIKETFIAIGDSFKTSDLEATAVNTTEEIEETTKEKE